MYTVLQCLSDLLKLYFGSHFSSFQSRSQFHAISIPTTPPWNRKETVLIQIPPKEKKKNYRKNNVLRIYPD